MDVLVLGPHEDAHFVLPGAAPSDWQSPQTAPLGEQPAVGDGHIRPPGEVAVGLPKYVKVAATPLLARISRLSSIAA